MRITKFSQMHHIKALVTPFVSDFNPQFRTLFGRDVDCSSNIPIDQFYAQEQNLINGFIDTSPDVLANPQSATHLMPTSAEKPLPADLTNEQLFDMLVPRKLQTPAEISRLARLKPNELEFKPVVEPSNNESNE